MRATPRQNSAVNYWILGQYRSCLPGRPYLRPRSPTNCHRRVGVMPSECLRLFPSSRTLSVTPPSMGDLTFRHRPERVRLTPASTAAIPEWEAARSRMGPCPDTCGWRRTCPPKAKTRRLLGASLLAWMDTGIHAGCRTLAPPCRLIPRWSGVPAFRKSRRFPRRWICFERGCRLQDALPISFGSRRSRRIPRSDMRRFDGS